MIWRKVGSGANSLFWYDPWVEGGPLGKRFERLFSLSLEKEGKILDIVEVRNGVVVWKRRWRRVLFEWELDKLRELLQEINNAGITWEGVDTWLRTKDSAGTYTVRSAYKWIRSSNLSAAENFHKKLWSCGAPLKVKAFV